MARLPLILASAFCGVFLGLPLLAIFADTFVGPEGFTLQGYSEILADPVDRRQLLYTLALGVTATLVSLIFGLGHAYLTVSTDLPGAAWLRPMGVVPLAMPPIFIAMGFADLYDVSGFWACAFLLGLAYAPFVAVLAARGLRSVDGRLYEAALVARGRSTGERLLLRLATPEILAGCLFAFVFIIAEHGVPEFLTVKGKTWHTYAEGIFARWKTRATGTSQLDRASPIVASLPLLAMIGVALVAALRLRASTTISGDQQPLPVRRLGRWRWPALALPVIYLGLGVGVPVIVMARWAAGSTQQNVPMSWTTMRASFHTAFEQGGGDLQNTILVGGLTCVLTLLVVIPLAHAAALRHPSIEKLSVLPIAVPAILLAMGMVHVFNSPLLARAYEVTGDLYESVLLLVFAYTARLLPFGVLTLTSAVRRQSASIREAASLTGRGPVARFFRIDLPILMPAVASVTCLVFVLVLRELDMAVLLPAGNDTVVRRLSNVVHFGGEDMGGALALLLLIAAGSIPLAIRFLYGRKLESLS